MQEVCLEVYKKVSIKNDKKGVKKGFDFKTKHKIKTKAEKIIFKSDIFCLVDKSSLFFTYYPSILNSGNAFSHSLKAFEMHS